MSLSQWPWMVVWVNAMWFVVRPLGRYLARRVDARTAIRPAEQERLMRVFDALGPERVALGLTATGHGWGDCFLTYATGGQPYGLRPALRTGWRTTRAPALSGDLTQAAVRVWDRKEAAFRALAAQWLERQQARGEPRSGRLSVAPGSLHTVGSASSRVESHYEREVRSCSTLRISP